MNRLLFSALGAVLFFFLTGPLSAADVTATVTKVTGKAQVQKGSDWVALTVGQVLAVGDTVSTGFRSELQLKIGPSTVTVKALSRLTLKDLVQSGTDVKTDLYLKVGKIDAEVNKSEAVATQKFTVSSPVSTASVRGTAFTYDGVNLKVTRGLVDFSDLKGNKVSVPVGEVAKATVGNSSQGLATNQNLVAQDSTTQSSSWSDYGNYDSWDSSSDWGSWDGWDYYSLLDSLYGYDWSSELPNVHVTIGGIY
jgi:hypothetical protein